MKKVLAAVFTGRFKSLSIVIAVIVVFVTTYALILPAVTLESDAVREEDGIVIQQDADIQETDGTGEQLTPGSEPDGQMNTDAQTNTDTQAEASEEDSLEAVSHGEIQAGNEETAVSGSDNEADKQSPEPDIQEFIYTAPDESMTVTAVAPAGVLPEGSSIVVREIAPFDATDKETADEDADVYSDALTAVADTLKDENADLNRAKVFDIYFIDPEGNEIEPGSTVDISISFRDPVDLRDGQENTESGIAHIHDDGNVEVIESNITTDINGDISEAAFSAETFSVYVVFNTSSTQTSEPAFLKEGWVRVGGDYKQPDPNMLPDGTHGGNDENGWKNYIRINLHTLKAGMLQDSMNPDDYNLTSTYAWLSGYDTFTVEDYEFNGNVVFTQFHPADRPIQDPTAGLVKGQTFDARTAFHNWSEDSWEVFENVLDIYVNTTPPQIAADKTEYVIRYYHADGTYDETTGYLTSGQSLGFSYADRISTNETYSGMTITTGNNAISANTGAGTGTISYNSGTSLVKTNIYYKENIAGKTGGTVNGSPLYDTAGTGASKVYDTSRTGLHTDKTAEVTSNSALNDGRTFDLTLESWNIGNSYANVGMVLDASGSMVWTSDTPTVIQYSDDEWRQILGGYRDWSGYHYYYDEVKGDRKILNPDLVNRILDPANCDYSKLNYNGYEYYVLDPATSVNEYAPLGYYDGSPMQSSNVCADDYRMTYSSNWGSGLDDMTAGWYYINSSDSAWYKAHGTAKAYCNYMASNSWSVDGYNNQKSTKFYIDNNGKLHCSYYRTVSGVSQEWYSDVYIKTNDGDTKSEVLQNSIARFTAILNALYPSTQMAMTRFSRSDFTTSDLVLLNWTDDTDVITAALNQTYGGGTATGATYQNGLAVYNYGFTGNTSTQSGIASFMQKLTNNQYGSYTPNTTNNNASKYLIIFTDGKDTDGASTTGTAAQYATQLKNSGYTIFTVLMQSAGMTSTDVATSTTFLKALAGTRTESGDNYFYSAMYDDPDALVDRFQQIAIKIAAPLEGYMIRDYIDPRFDIVDNEGNILTQLNPQGQWSPRTIDTADGKRAILKYDQAKKMFYLEIEQQTIPTSPRGATEIPVNSTTITVRAKQDFFGGNDILTNGNEAEQNSVFKPADDGTIHADEPTPADPSAAKKDFPKTTADPASLNITLSNYEDTIFLGETISPAALYEQVQTKRDQDPDHRSMYFNYLLRAGQKLQGDQNYYLNLLKYASVPAGAANTDPGKDINGRTINGFEFQSDANGVIKLTLPYYYLENPGDVTSYAGGNLHQADKVGTVTYTWKALDTGGHTLTDNNALLDYESTAVDTVRYQLSVSYAPDPFVNNSLDNNGNIIGDNIANNGSARTLTLTGQKGQDKLIKDPAGDPAVSQATDTNTQGLAAVHIVSGKFKLTKKLRITQAEWNEILGKAGADGVTFVFDLKKEGASYSTISINSSSNDVNITVDGDYIVLDLTTWVEHLPQGDYTVDEVSMPDGFALSEVQGDQITITDGDDDRPGGVGFAAPYEGSVSWHIGQSVSGTPASCYYGDTDFSAEKVKDSVKEVDPALSADGGKYYLNAQIAKGILINIRNSLELLKKDAQSGEALGGAKFSLMKDNQYVDLSTLMISKLSPASDEPAIETITVGSNPNVSVVNVPAGGIKIDGLANGTYVLTEEIAPAGYLITEQGKEFVVENGYLKIAEGDPSESISFEVENTPGAALPVTGGPGTTVMYLAGSILTGSAAAWLLLRRRSNN